MQRQHRLINYLRSKGVTSSATHTPDDGDLAGQLSQYEFERTAPGATLSGDALTSGAAQG